MHRLRTAHPLIRLFLAGLFAAMSLFHGPVMAFARAGTAPAQHAAAASEPATAHHHQAAAAQAPADHDDGGPELDVRVLPSACYAVGCFIALAASSTGVPAAIAIPLGLFGPARARTLAPAWPDPAVPPPRLRV